METTDTYLPPQVNKSLSFDEYPTLDMLLVYHTAGFDYLLGLASNVAKWSDEGWQQIANVKPFRVKHLTMLLFRKGEPVWGGNHQDNLPKFYVDVEADRELGIRNPDRLEVPPPPKGKELTNGNHEVQSKSGSTQGNGSKESAQGTA